MTTSSAHNAGLRSSSLYIGLALLLTTIISPTHSPAQDKGYGLSVHALSGELVDAVPGHIQSVSFRVTNSLSQAEECVESLELPQGWQAIIPTGIFTLRPTEEVVRIIAFQVPGYTLAGRYDIKYSVRSQRDYAITDSASIGVVVSPVGRLTLSIEEKPDFVIAGQELRLRVRVVNQGNVPVKVRVNADSRHVRQAAIVEPRIIEIPARGSALVTVTAKTDHTASKPYRHFVVLKAEEADSGDGISAAPVTIGVDVIPGTAGGDDLRHYLPTVMSYREVGQGDKAGAQVTWSGRGTLDEAGTKHVEFLVRTPDTQEASVLGWREEYRLNYSSNDVQLRFGDQSYGLSQLTDYLRYGRGFGVDLARDDDTRYGAYYQASRWQSPGTATTGAYISHKVSEDATVKVNLLSRNRNSPDGSSLGDDSIWSIEADVKPLETSRLQVEYGRSRTEVLNPTSDEAYRVELSGSTGGNTHYSFRKTHAGADYQGYYRDTDHTRLSLASLMGNQLQGSISYSRWQRNLNAREEGRSAPRERLLQINLRHPLPDNWQVSLGYDDFRRTDLLSTSGRDLKSEILRLGIGHSREKWSFRGEVLDVRQTDLLAGESGHSMHYRLYASYRPTPKQFFTIYGGFGDSDVLRGSRLLSGKYLGFSAHLQPRDDLTISAWYTGDNISGDRPESDQGEIRLAYTLPGDQTWTLLVRQTNMLSERKTITSYDMLYTIPIDIPVGKKTSVGIIRGRISDAGGQGIEGAILSTNGTAVVSGPDGRFSFPTLPPGTYSLTVDKRSIGLNRITEQRLPIALEVRGGEASLIDLLVTESARFSGRIKVIAPDEKHSPEGYVTLDPMTATTPDLSDILVELSGDDEIIRRLTDRNGAFLFEGMRPGKYRFTVHEHSLPAQHHLETPQQSVELKPGDETSIEVNLNLRLRRILMIDDSSDVEVTDIR